MNRLLVKEYGLDVLYRHDYDDLGDEIASYVEQSCEYLKAFLTNVPGSEKFYRVLDIGCGGHEALDFFERMGLRQAWGVDKYPQSQDPRIVKGDFYELSKLSGFFNHPFDVIFINHTLEHSLAPLLLEQVRKVHNKGGVIFVAVPDADYSWAYDITSSTTHWSIFNEGFLRTLLQRYGYESTVEKVCLRDNRGELWAVGIKRW